MRYFLLLFLLVMLTSCSFQTTKLDDLIHLDVYYVSDNNEEILVKTISDTSLMQPYYDSLFPPTANQTQLSPDLAYKLNIRTREKLIKYTLIFDLSKKIAVATNSSGTYSIPFDWVVDYLNSLSLEDQFSYLSPPDFNISINDNPISLAIDQDWDIVPANGVAYDMLYTTTSYETYQSLDTDINIKGYFANLEPDNIIITLSTENDSQVFKDPSLDNIPLPDIPGRYIYNIKATWNTPENGYTGTIIYTFGLNITLPIDYILNETSFEPGDCLSLLITNTNNLDYEIKTDTYNKTIGLFYYGENNQHLVALVPLDSRTTPGDYTINIYKNKGNTLVKTIDYAVIKKEFETQQLSISSTTASLKSQENSRKDNEKFGDAKSFSAGTQLWEGAFLMPVNGRISTEYATIRYVNKGVESSRHNALDIAAPTGTPILATNNGIVTFASDLIISGNVVVIDHGYGLFSSYVHLDKIFVEDGQEVSKGEIIGEVGTTGYSTGPHLHWALWKNGVYLNPWKFIESDPLLAFANQY